MNSQASTFRLEPLELKHVEGLVAAAAPDPSLYQWSPVPQGHAEAQKYVETALAWKAAGTALPFATVRLSDGGVIGSTRFWNIEHWAWPQGHDRHARGLPDACEISFSWLTPSAIRTAANTEANFDARIRVRKLARASSLFSHRAISGRVRRSNAWAPNSREFCGPIEWRLTSFRVIRSVSPSLHPSGLRLSSG